MHSGIQKLFKTTSSLKGFSLLEMIIVIAIVSILIAATSRLFTMPSKYLMDSERCIASLDGYVKQFFYNAVSGKSLSISGESLVTDNYTIIFRSGGNTGDFQIALGYDSGSGGVILSESLSPNGGDKMVPGCRSSKHYVSLSGSLGGIISPNIRIDIHKNLSNQGNIGPMTLCQSDNDNNCSNGKYVTGMVHYSTCSRGSTGGCTSDKELLAEFFDTRTQTIKTRKCLSLPILDSNCTKWSIDEF